MCDKRKDARETVDRLLVDAMTRIVQIKPYTIVELYAKSKDGTTYRGVGLAQQGKQDKWNAEMGVDIARGRAVMQIAKKMGLLDKYVVCYGPKPKEYNTSTVSVSTQESVIYHLT